MITRPQLLSKSALFAILVGLLILCCGNAMGAIIYIPDKYPTIQQAIDAAFEGDTIIVRDGIYLLIAAIDFKGKAITLKSQNGASNCILDGQQKTRILYFHSGETNNSILSGFTIQNGMADKGGGIYCEQSSPTITQCLIKSNTAYFNGADAYGGGIYLNSSSPTINFCSISNNSAISYLGLVNHSGVYAHGGGIYSSASSPIIANSSIIGNIANGTVRAGSSSGSDGGGISVNGGAPILSNTLVGSNNSIGNGDPSKGGGIFAKSTSLSLIGCTLGNNSTPNNGGGMFGGGIYLYAASLSAVNCIVNGNSSGYGAGIYFDASTGWLTNCTIARNIAITDGGGVNCANSSPQIVNCILWEDSPNEIVKSGTGNPKVAYSDVSGGYTGTGNINSNPLFVDIAGQDFHLKSNSPCVNTGDNTAPYLPTTDRDGNARISNSVVDMGAYEYQGCPIPDKAALVSPANSDTTASPTYTWRAAANATYYFLWVDDSTGNKVKIWYTTTQANCNSSTGLCSVTPQVALAPGAVQWWIQTWNSCGYGPWSSAASFTAGALPGAAILVSPKGPNISTTPTYTWNAVPTATYYLLWVRDYTGFPRIQTWYSPTELGCTSGTGTCSIKPTTTLLPGNALWWVQTYNSNGNGPWSDEMDFTVTGAAAPGKAVLVSPSGDISTASPAYKWNAVPSASWYFLYVQDATAFWGRVTTWFTASQAGCPAGTGVCSITPNSVLAPGAATWWIRTWNDMGTGPWSDGMSFTVPSASTAPANTP